MSAPIPSRLALAGFQTITREGIVVLQGQTSTVDFALKVSTVSEEVTVKGETPVVDTKSANVNVNLDKALLDTTPGGKDIWSILEYKAPGVIFDTPDVGGNQGGLQRGMTSRGTPNSQNTQMLNGVNVNDPAAQGFSMIYYTPSTFENIQVSSGAQDISVGTGGVFINMVTKSGTNRTSAMAPADLSGPGNAVGQHRRGRCWTQGFRPEAAAVDFITNTNVADRRTATARTGCSISGRSTIRTRASTCPGSRPSPLIPVLLADTSQQDTTDIGAVAAKLTYQANTSNRFEGYLERQQYDKPNRGANATTTQDSNSKEFDFFNVAQVAWNSVLTDRMFVDTKLSYNNTKFPLSQKTNLQPITDAATEQHAAPQPATARRSCSGAVCRSCRTSSTTCPSSSADGTSSRSGFDNGYTPEDVDTYRVDNVNLTYRSAAVGTNPAGPVSVQIFNSPLHTESRRHDDGALRPGLVCHRPAHGHRRHPVGTHRGLPPRAGDRRERVLPRRARLRGRHHQRRHPGLHGPEVVPGSAQQPALVQLCAAVQRRRTICSATAGP